MMNKKRQSIAPIDSPTLNGLELQSTSPTTAQDTTTPQPPEAEAPSSPTTRQVTSIHVTALDSIVNVNSLFTMSVFIGFSLTVPEAATAGSRPECNASRTTVRRLIVFEVISFSFFLFSSLIAQSLKLTINLVNNSDLDPDSSHKADIHPNMLKYGLFVSAIGSVVGCSFLMLSIVDFIQVKLGVYSCGGAPVYAVVTLVVFVGLALMAYVITAVCASFFVEFISKGTDTKKVKN